MQCTAVQCSADLFSTLLLFIFNVYTFIFNVTTAQLNLNFQIFLTGFVIKLVRVLSVVYHSGFMKRKLSFSCLKKCFKMNISIFHYPNFIFRVYYVECLRHTKTTQYNLVDNGIRT